MNSTAIRSVARGAKKSIRQQGLRRSLATIVSAPSADPVDYDQITTLSNGLRVATEALPGPFAGIGVYVDAGSRYESDELAGVSHIVDRLAFKSTSSRTAVEMLEAIDSLGGNFQCASSRESLMYQAATFNSAVPSTLALLAETIRDPLITEEEVAQQVETAEYEVREIWAKPDLILPELVNVAAFSGNTLGNPLLCPQERLSSINKQIIDKYRSIFFHPERLVLAFAGVSHDTAMKLAEQYFGDMVPRSQRVSAPSMPTSSTSTHLSTSDIASGAQSSDPLPILHKAAHYTGGFMSLPKLPPPINPTHPDLSYIHLGFEGLAISSDDIYALATLQTLLGGGGSFSAGGPGKGMYTRLYTNVLNQNGWTESCVSFNNSYTDSGVFGISASCHPGQTKQMLEVLCRELNNLTLTKGPLSLQPIEVNRAKNQLRSSLLMNLESRMIELEDLGRQVQVHGKKIEVKEMCSKIDALTVDDLRRVAGQVVRGQVNNPGKGSGAPTVVIQEGSSAPADLMNWEQIQDRISKWKLGRR